MKSLYTSEGAAQALDRYGAAHGEDLALRAYTSRLIGSEPGLVLHVGGSTSVPVVRQFSTAAKVQSASWEQFPRQAETSPSRLLRTP